MLEIEQTFKTMSLCLISIKIILCFEILSFEIYKHINIFCIHGATIALFCCFGRVALLEMTIVNM